MLVLGYVMFLPVLVIPIIMLLSLWLNYSLYLVLCLKLWLLSPVDDQVEYFQDVVE